MKIVIIGAVASGMSFAAKYRRLDPDAEIVVFDQDDEVSYAACALPYYIADHAVALEDLYARSVEEFEKNGIIMHVNEEVTRVDVENKKVFAGEREESYDKLIIATGAEPVIPKLYGLDLEGVYTLKTPAQAERIKQALEGKRRVHIVGGGYIGIEMAEALLELGKDITLIQRPDRLLPRYDKEITDKIYDVLKEKMTIQFGESVQGFEGDTHLQRIVTDKGSYDTDFVLLAVGFRPSTDLFKDVLELAPDGSIVTEPNCETSVKDVYAIGDAATMVHRVSGKSVNIKLGTIANRQGRYLAEIIAGNREVFPGILGTNMIKVLDWEVAATGLNEIEARELFDVETVFIENTLIPSYMDRDPRDNVVFCKMIKDTSSQRILGVQLMGKEGAATRINTMAVAIHNNMSVQDLEYVDMGYHPSFQTTWDVTQIAAGQLD